MILTMMSDGDFADEDFADEDFAGGRNQRKVDIMIKPEQRIQEVYRGLIENGYFTPLRRTGQIRVYSFRQEGYINPMLTFGQGGIYSGDILRIF